MKIGFRIPSIKKRIAARTSVKRYIRQSLGVKMPKGWGWISDPRKAAYNRAYNRVSGGCMVAVVYIIAICMLLLKIL